MLISYESGWFPRGIVRKGKGNKMESGGRGKKGREKEMEEEAVSRGL